MMYKILMSVVCLVALAGCSESGPEAAATEVLTSSTTITTTPPLPAKKIEAQASTVTPAVAAGKYVAGKHYRVLARPLATNNPNKVEVAEFFWYGCSHCYTFEALAQPYKQSLPDTIEFIPIPAMWNQAMQVHAKAYYATLALNKPELHAVIFDAMNIDRKRLGSESEIANLFAANGVDKAEALKVLGSFGVSAQVNKARSLATGAKLSGTPTLMVNGKYVIESSLAGSQAEMLKVADYLARLEVSR